MAGKSKGITTTIKCTPRSMVEVIFSPPKFPRVDDSANWKRDSRIATGGLKRKASK